MRLSFTRHNLRLRGQGEEVLLFAHGYGCDQTLWSAVAPAFEGGYSVALFDFVGLGGSEKSAFDAKRHATLDGYADDLLELAQDVHDGPARGRPLRFIGHSVSSMIGVLAAIRKPELFSQLILLCPSARYLNDPPGYVGGFERPDLERLLELMELNPQGWAGFLAPAVMGNPDKPALASSLSRLFCAMDPQVARTFARATFFSDNRGDLPKCRVPCVVLQSAVDAIASPEVGRYVHEHLPRSTYLLMETSGHCPHVSHPMETLIALRRALESLVP